VVEVKREDKLVALSYEAWLSSNVLSIDNALNRGDFDRAHFGITTLFKNMLIIDRKGLIEFINEHPGDYRLSSGEAEDYLEPTNVEYTLIQRITDPWGRGTWGNIYMAMIDYFRKQGYLFKTRTIEVGTD